MSKVTLFDGKVQEGDRVKVEIPNAYSSSFDDAQAKELKATPKEDLLIDLYLDVGLYCGMSWKQFYEETPYWAIKGIKKRLNEKLENKDEAILSWTHLAFLMTLARAFGKK